MGKMLGADLVCKGLQAEVREQCGHAAAEANNEGVLLELDAIVRKLVLALGDWGHGRGGGSGRASAHGARAMSPLHAINGVQAVAKYDDSLPQDGTDIYVCSPYMTSTECHVERLVLRAWLGGDRDGPTLALCYSGMLARIELRGTKTCNIYQDGGAEAQALMSEGILDDPPQLLPVGQLYVEADGFMLWIDDGWHEVKLAALLTSSKRADISKDRRQATHRQDMQVQGTPDELGMLLWQTD